MIGPQDPRYKDAYFVIQLINVYDDVYYAGGHLHILLDDQNYDDSCVEFCIQNCKEQKDQWGELIATTLKQFTPEERQFLLEEYWSASHFLNFED